MILTDRDFYNFELKADRSAAGGGSPSKKQKLAKKLQKKNFTVNLHMEPDGAKLIQVKIEKLKIIIKPHIFFTI